MKVRRPRLTGLWRHPDFVNLWAGSTISIFGTLVGRTALPFAAILTLDATPFEIALLAQAELVPGFAFGLVAGVWVDRLPRRPILIAADVGRALLLALIPLAAVFDVLGMGLIYAVAALTSVLSAFFDVAYQSYLPTLVSREELVEGNSKLSASASVAEVASFGSGGWLVQLLTAPIAILIDALSFVASALFILRIRAPEPPPMPAAEREGTWREAVAGLRVVLENGTLRALAVCNFIWNAGFRIGGTVFLLYVTRELGLGTGPQGLIYAVGGVSSLLGAVATGPATRRWGPGPTLIAALLLAAVGQLFVPLAGVATTTAVVVAFLVAQQLTVDPALTAFDITQVSLRQAIAPDAVQGRVNATMRFTEFGAQLIGAAIGGVLGEVIGLRPTLLVAASGVVLAAFWLLLSPVRGLRRAVAVASEGEEAPPVTELP